MVNNGLTSVTHIQYVYGTSYEILMLVDLHLYHQTQIAISSELLTLSMSYFLHIILHGKIYFGVLHKQGTDITRFDTPRIQKRHIPKSECSNHFKFLVYIVRSCCYWPIWFINFYFIRYGDTGVQSLSTFPARFTRIHWIGRGLPKSLAQNNLENVH